MKPTFETLSRDVVQLPRHQRLALARFLIELDNSSSEENIDSAWEAEIGERIRVVKEGRAEGIPYEQVLAWVDESLAR